MARYVYDINFLGSLWAASRGEKVIGFWTTRYGAAHALAGRLHDDDLFRARVAREAFGMVPEDFDKALDLWVRQLGDQKKLLLIPNGFSDSEAIAILLGHRQP